MNNLFEFKNYINLYKFASIKLNELIKEKTTIVIYTNCASLIAGLSFNIIRLQKYNINIILNDNIDISKNKINLILGNSNFDFKYDLYFKYIGNEENILCIK